MIGLIDTHTHLFCEEFDDDRGLAVIRAKEAGVTRLFMPNIDDTTIVVALGVPLYLQLRMIKKQLLPIILSQLAGCIVGLISVTVVAKLLGATPEVIMSLAPKSVTTPIAMEVSSAVGGIPSLTAAVVIVVGLFGAIFGFKVLQVGHVHSPIAQGLSMGTATHAVGTSRAMEVSGKYGAYASLGLTLNGIFTA